MQEQRENKEDLNPQKVQIKKPGNRLLYSFLVVICAGVIASTTMSATALAKIQQLTEDNSEDIESEEETAEDDVLIADEYTIRSTSSISDAYLSGNSSSLSAEDQETLSMASKVLDEIITENMSDYEKEKAVYDWMTTNISTDDGMMEVIPDTEEDVDRPYGVLKNHQAVCVGYATTFRLLMQMMDIPCMVVHNSECYHSWDLVQLDGHWYHTDVYSDSESGNYNNFNLDDDLMSQTEDWDMSYFPAADSLTYNVAYQDAEEAADIYEMPQKLRETLNDKKGMLSLNYKNISEEDEFALYQMIDEIETKLWSTDEYENVYMNYSINDTEDGCLFVVYIDYSDTDYDVDTDSAVSEETQQKMDDAVQDAFGDLKISQTYADSDMTDFAYTGQDGVDVEKY